MLWKCALLVAARSQHFPNSIRVRRKSLCNVVIMCSDKKNHYFACVSRIPTTSEYLYLCCDRACAAYSIAHVQKYEEIQLHMFRNTYTCVHCDCVCPEIRYVYVCGGRACGMLWKCVLREKGHDYFACGQRYTTLSEYLYMCGGRICEMLWKYVLRENVDDYFACGRRNTTLSEYLYVCVGRVCVECCGNVL